MTDIPLSNVETQFPSIHSKREDARKLISIIVVLAFAFIVIASFFSLWFRGQTPVDDIVKIISALISPVVGIVGAVTGFYFGENRENTEQ